MPARMAIKPDHKIPPSTSADTGSFWAPFAYPTFLVIWGATLAGNIATAMRKRAAAWLMTFLAGGCACSARCHAPLAPNTRKYWRGRNVCSWTSA